MKRVFTLLFVVFAFIANVSHMNAYEHQDQEGGQLVSIYSHEVTQAFMQVEEFVKNKMIEGCSEYEIRKAVRLRFGNDVFRLLEYWRKSETKLSDWHPCLPILFAVLLGGAISVATLGVYVYMSNIIPEFPEYQGF